nr:reverse transcriptase domain-containing protein [Tanacetum cinerariifolium]
MSSASSAVTYTSVYTDSEPRRVFWGADEELSDGGSPQVIVYGYDGLPMLPVAPPSPDYIPVLEEPQTPPTPQDEDEHEPMFIQPHDPNFMPETIYPEYIPLEDEHILSAEEQPLHPIVSPTAKSLGYVAESNLEEYLEEYEDDETEDGPAAISFPPEAEVKRLLAMPTPSPSPLALLSSPSVGERLARCTAPAALPLPPLLPPLHMPPPIDHRDDIPETEMPPRKRYEVRESSTTRLTGGRGINYGFVNTLDAKARRRGIGEVGYGIRDTWVDPTEAVPEIAPMTIGEVNTRVTELAELHEHDTQDLYALLDDAYDSRTRISQRVAVDAQRVYLLMKDRIAHQETIQIVKDEAYVAREAWRQEQMVETLRVMGDMRREIGDMQAELLALREQPRRARQPGGDARVPNHQDAPRDADSHIWGQIRSLGPDAYSMTWEVLKKKMTDKYSPQGKIKKLEIELWNLKVKENNVSSYTERFQELTLICTKFVADETEKIDKFLYWRVRSREARVLWIDLFGNDIPVWRTCLRHHLQSPTLLSTPILNRGEYFREPTRSYQKEEQPLPPVVSPTADSPEYVAESDLEEDPNEYEDDETGDGPVDHLMDGVDDRDDDDGDSSGYDADDEDEDEEDEEEEEEPLAPADSAVVIPTDELTSISLPPEAEVERLLAMPTLPPSPLASLSPPSVGERLARCTAPAALPSPPLLPSSYPLPPVDCTDGIPESEQPPHKRLCLSTLGSRGYDDSPRDSIDRRGGGLCCPRGLGSFGKVKPDVHHELQTLRKQMQQTEMARLRKTDRVRQSQIVETLRVIRDMKREMGDMQAELLALRGHPRRPGQLGGYVRIPNHQDAPRDDDSHI